MKSKDKKAVLSSYINAKARLSATMEEMARIRSAAYKITPTLNDSVVSGSHTSDKVGNAIVALEECEQVLEERGRELSNTLNLVLSAIDTVNDHTLREILELKYINGYTLEQIAVVMNYSYIHICRLHGSALYSVEIDDMEC